MKRRRPHKHLGLCMASKPSQTRSTKRRKMSDSQTACAHCKIESKHTDNPNGTRTDYWECCSGCGCRFIPESLHLLARADLLKENAELRTQLIALEAACKVKDEALRCAKDCMLAMNGGCYPLPYPDSNMSKRRAFDVVEQALTTDGSKFVRKSELDKTIQLLESLHIDDPGVGVYAELQRLRKLCAGKESQ